MSCVACGLDGHLEMCLDLGLQPLANKYRARPDDIEDEYQLGVKLCHKCHHLQLVHFVNPDEMFKNYIWVSGTSGHYKKYLKWFAETIRSRYPNAKNILDIGCNDGSQLDEFKALGFETFGVDPAVNLAVKSSLNHSIRVGYFDDTYPSHKFDIITAANVFGHTRDPLNFLENAKRLTHDDSIIFIQTSQADMIINNEFDTIYHEHVSFFNCKSMKILVERAGLVLRDVFKTNIHGTTYVFVISKTGEFNLPLMDSEMAMGLYSDECYVKWSRTCVEKASKLRAKLEGKRVIGYGAAAKGNTLLNFIKIKPEVIIDDNPLKIGLFTPGMGSEIVSSEYIKTLGAEPVVFLILAWNLMDEIKTKILDIRSNPLDEFVSI
jgi:SAM-dependent methyltransferase